MTAGRDFVPVLERRQYLSAVNEATFDVLYNAFFVSETRAAEGKFYYVQSYSLSKHFTFAVQLTNFLSVESGLLTEWWISQLTDVDTVESYEYDWNNELNYISNSKIVGVDEVNDEQLQNIKQN